MEVLVKCAVLQDLQLHSLFLYRWSLLQSTQSFMGTSPQLYPSKNMKVRWWQENSELEKEWTEQKDYNIKNAF